MRDSEIIQKVVDFLKESSNFYSTSVKDRVECERMFSGDFWTDERMREWKRSKKVCEHLSQWYTAEYVPE